MRPFLAINFFFFLLKYQLNENVNVFSNRTVYELISGYSDFLIDFISQRQPDSFKDGKFSLLNGVNI